jgi:hypothetical protein
VFFQQKFATFVNKENLKHLISNWFCLSQWVANIRGFFAFQCCDTKKNCVFCPKKIAKLVKFTLQQQKDSNKLSGNILVAITQLEKVT